MGWPALGGTASGWYAMSRAKAFRSVFRGLGAIALATALTACSGGPTEFGASGDPSVETAALTSGLNPALTGAAASDPVAMGRRHFAEGNYGLAEENYRKAAELGPRDLEAWIGLAASYDRLKRFDLADRAYNQAIRLGGRSATILNNQGFSHMLRGDLKRARTLLAEARKLEPDNPSIVANLDLLEDATRLSKDIR